MHIKYLHLQNFRLFENVSFEFSPDFNMILGENGCGKTTILEAIYLLATGGSFRTHNAREMISSAANKTPLFLDCLFVKHDIEQRLRLSFENTKRSILYNNTAVPSASGLLGLLLVVVASPDDINLVKGIPSLRRQFLDLQIAQADPLYVHYLKRYSKAMEQRNFLLKKRSSETIDCWENEMAQAAAYLCTARKQTVEELNTLTTDLHLRLASKKEILNISYKSSLPINDSKDLKISYLDLFKNNRKREFDLGTTLHGPHKDDLLILMNGMDSRNYASEGQMRSTAVTLRAAEWLRLKSKSDGQQPIFLFDDIGIGMDSQRTSQLTEYLKSSLGQVFASSAVLNIPNAKMLILQ